MVINNLFGVKLISKLLLLLNYIFILTIQILNVFFYDILFLDLNNLLNVYFMTIERTKNITNDVN